MLISRIQNFANDPWNVKKLREMRSLHARVSSFFMVDQDKPLGISLMVLADPAGKSWLDYGVLIDDPKLGQRDGAQLKVSITYRLSTEAGEVALEDMSEAAWPAYSDASADGKFAPFVIASRIPIEPGAYKLTIEVNNRQAQQTFRGEADVAAGPVKAASYSGPLITTSVERVARPNAFQPFQYFGVQFHPSAKHEVSHPDPLRLLFELHEPPGSTADYQMEYIVASPRDKDARRSITESVKHAEFKDGRLLKSKSIAINDLENGDYRLIVNLRQEGSREVLASSNSVLRISADKAELPLYFLADTRGFGAARHRCLPAGSPRLSHRRTMPPRQTTSDELTIKTPPMFWPVSGSCSCISAIGSTLRSRISTSGSASTHSKARRSRWPRSRSASGRTAMSSRRRAFLRSTLIYLCVCAPPDNAPHGARYLACITGLSLQKHLRRGR